MAFLSPCPQCGAEATVGCPACQPRLEVQDGPRSRTVALAGDRITLGHAADCDIVLDATCVAEHHAHFELIGGAHRIVADDDPGRLLLHGAPVTDGVLHDGDVLRLPDPTTGAFASLVYRNRLAPPIDPIQHFATPPGRELLTIGRSDADIVLDQPLVSRHHADLAWSGGRHVLRDADSAYGTFVNGERLRGDRPLAPGDVVQIGTFRLTYDGDSLDTLDERGAIRLDARALSRVVGSGDDRRTILHETTISIEPCEFVGLVGGSGAGKSTLMMALSGFQPADDGTVLVNGDDFYAGFDAYRSILGYVPQDDILHRSLPVDEALRYAAKLRLPADTADDEIERRIDEALAAVDMSGHRDKRIAQLSGGQRKRVSIASEMLADPSLLFLDEPTSGLDPGLERRMMYTLRKLADAGRTVVLVTHATANIGQCDHIAFMASGRVVFFGPPYQALEFFGVDDFADIYTLTEGEATDADGLAEEYAEWTAAHPGKTPLRADLWTMRFKRSLQFQTYAVERLGRAPDQPSEEQHAAKQQRAEAYAQKRWHQFAVLTRRYLRLMALDRRNLALLLLQAPVIGLLLLMVARPDSFTSRIEAKKLLFMLSTVGVWFGVINGAREICKEAVITRRERLAGMRVGPYLASKFVVLWLLVLAQSALLLGVLALRVDMPPAGVMAPPALEIYATIAMSGLAGIALGLCVSVVASTPDKATSLIPIVLVPQVLFAGLMFALRGVTDLLSWFTTSRWAMDALGATVDVNALPVPIPLPYEPQYAPTATVLVTAWAAMFGHAFGCAAIAWVALKLRR